MLWSGDAAKKTSGQLILDAPFFIHLPKTLLWAGLQAALLATLALTLRGDPALSHVIAMQGGVILSGHASNRCLDRSQRDMLCMPMSTLSDCSHDANVQVPAEPPDLDWRPGPITCAFRNPHTRHLISSIGALILVYIVMFLNYLICGGMRLSQLPSSSYRTANILQKWQVH